MVNLTKIVSRRGTNVGLPLISPAIGMEDVEGEVGHGPSKTKSPNRQRTTVTGGGGATGPWSGLTIDSGSTGVPLTQLGDCKQTF